MKKYINPILSIILGILTFGLYAAPFFTYEGVMGVVKSGSCYEAIVFENASDSIIAFSIFSIALLVMAGFLIVSGVFMILQNANIIKSKSISKLNNFLQVITFVIALATLICYLIVYGDIISATGPFGDATKDAIKVGATSITIAIVSLLTTILCFIFQDRKKKRK